MHRHQQLSPLTGFASNTIARAFALITVLISLAFGAGCVPNGITVEWTTASEEKTAGFNLYRADTAEGEYVKINAQLIPGSPDPLKGGKYKYQDTTADPARAYYYKLEEIQVDGRANWHGPISVTGDSFNAGIIWGAGGIGLGIILIGVFLLWARRRAPSS